MQLHHAMEHHAKDKTEVINAIGIAFATILNPAGWQVGNRRFKKTAGSWFIYHPDKPGRRYYFSNGGKGIVLVRDAILYKNAKRVSFKNTNPEKVFVWAKRLAKS